MGPLDFVGTFWLSQTVVLTRITEDWQERLQPELCQKLGVTRLPPVAPEVRWSTRTRMSQEVRIPMVIGSMDYFTSL